MKRCPNCNKELNDNAKFCTACGQRLEEAMPLSVPKEKVSSKKVPVGILIGVCICGAAVLGWNAYSNKAYEENILKAESVMDEKDYDPTKNDSSFPPTETSVDIYESNDSSDILAGSEFKYLSKMDLMGLSAEECRLARNEIYARHGRIFKDKLLQDYFEAFDWYYPLIPAEEFDESMLNEYEIYNRDLIVEYEKEMGYR